MMVRGVAGPTSVHFDSPEININKIHLNIHPKYKRKTKKNSKKNLINLITKIFLEKIYFLHSTINMSRSVPNIFCEKY